MSTLKLEGAAWKNFLDVERSEQTKYVYTIWISHFMKYCKIRDPNKLLEIGTVHQIEDKVIEWLGTFKTVRKATATMKTALAAVVFFYRYNRIVIDTKYISQRIPKTPIISHRSPTKEEVAKIIDCANMRGKALAGIFASSGIRSGAVPPLKLRHIRKPLPNELEHHDCGCKDRNQPLRFNGYLLNVYEGEDEQYFTFISEEASKWIDTYHTMRKNAGEIIALNSPLIREEFDAEKPRSVKTPKVINEAALQSVMSRLAVAAGVKPIIRKANKEQVGGHRNEWKNVHGYRQFFSTAATNAGVNFSFKELMLGHHLNLEKSYYDSNNPRSVHSALAEYLKMQDAVTIFSNSRLERENETLRVQNEKNAQTNARLIRKLIEKGILTPDEINDAGASGQIG